MNAKPTDVSDFIGELNAGVFEKQLGAVLSDVASGVVANGKQGEVTIKLKIKQISDTSQVNISHSLDYKTPTSKGHRSELVEGATPMHVLHGGGISIMPASAKAHDYMD
ncbi:hypothetical protein ABLT40_09750 [Acinetobacter schindleri]|uniref:hypothetical protein n=1 Tax=Acinetobacter schindleri TaxID=108981 RepID=UPI0032B459A0